MQAEDLSAAEVEVRAVIAIAVFGENYEQLIKLVDEIPTGLGLAVLCVLPDSLGPDLIESRLSGCALTVILASDGVPVLPDQLYLISSALATIYEDGKLRIQPVSVIREGTQVDTLFCSLSEHLGRQAIGILLGGSGGDGLEGLETIKAGGGVSFAESHGEPGMPSLGSPDYIFTLEKISGQLRWLARHPYLEGSENAENLEDVEEYLPRVLALLRQHSSVDFSLYKPATIRRRIMRRVLLQRLDDLDSYFQILRQSSAAVEDLFQDLLITVTGLFRDPEVFSALTCRVLPVLVHTPETRAPLRVWVPGCSRGDEAYSLAICLLEVLGERAATKPIQIFASDVSDKALERARLGLYPEWISDHVSSARLERFFTRTENGYQINKAVRDLCVFARQDLTRDPPFSRLDMISCRNVLIYLNQTLQMKILRIFHYALKPGGVLLLGGSESLGRAGEFFVQIDRSLRIYSRRAMAPTTAIAPFEAAAIVQAGPRDRLKEVPASGSSGGIQDLQREADRITLSRFGPPGVVVNREFAVLQYRGRTGLFLEHPSGSVTNDLLKLLREGLLSDVRAMLLEARERSMPVRRRGLRVQDETGWNEIDVEVSPFQVGYSGERNYLVFFLPVAAGHRDLEPPIEHDVQAELAHLRQELAATREYLNAINHEQEATLESLQAANEEIQSANEELQSTNEELETAKEELQSTNEELTTVNEEMHGRNQELTRVNDDLTNLLSSVNIPVVILDPDMRIRRFTPMARQVLNVIPSDVGRPVRDLRPHLEIPHLERRVQEVLDSLAPQQLDLQDDEGRWFSVRIRPYRTKENQIDGAVVVFVDVDQMKRSLEEARAARELAGAVLDLYPKPMLVLTREGVIEEANSLFCETYGLSPESLLQKPLHEICGGRWSAPALQAALRDLPEATSFPSVPALVTWAARNGETFRAELILSRRNSAPVIFFGLEPARL